MTTKIRNLALEITNDLYSIGRKYVKHQTIIWFFEKFFKPRVDNIIINDATEAELKQIMFSCKEKLNKAFRALDTVEELKEASKVNEPEMTKRLMAMPSFKDLEELF